MPLLRLKNIVFDRIPVEIFIAHEALGIFMAISDKSDVLNTVSHRNIFGIIQRQSLGTFILSLCKLFERASKKYQNFSIPTALEYLYQHLDNVTVTDQSFAKLIEFIRSEIDPTFDVQDRNRIPQMVYTHFENLCPRTPLRDGNKLDAILDALKVIRDKRVAHHEDHDLAGLTVTDLDGAIELLCFAQTFVNIIGFGLFGFSMDTITLPENFAPDKTESYNQINSLIQGLAPIT